MVDAGSSTKARKKQARTTPGGSQAEEIYPIHMKVTPYISKITSSRTLQSLTLFHKSTTIYLDLL